jgi:hypothetical protein
MTDTKNLQVNETKLIANISRQSFYHFVQIFWGTIIQETPVLNWHIKVMCDELQKLAHQVMKGLPREYDLIINVPPGTTKSTIVSQMFPAWVWTIYPSAKFIHASYADRIALKDSIRTRDIVESELYKACFGIELRSDENMKGLFSNTQGGFRLSAGVGGAVTGYHGHFLIVDDPINPEEAFSDAELKVANRWMETTLPPRRIEKASAIMILVQQRLHQGDPTGEMLEKTGGRGIKHICLPAELTERVSPPELRKYYVDGLLDPHRLPRAALDKVRENLGEYGYASQFLQDPVPLGGGMFQVKELKYINDLKYLPEYAGKVIRWVRSWDKAGTKDGGAYSVGMLMGITDKNYLVIKDVVRGRWEVPSARRRSSKWLTTMDTTLRFFSNWKVAVGAKSQVKIRSGCLSASRCMLITRPATKKHAPIHSRLRSDSATYSSSARLIYPGFALSWKRCAFSPSASIKTRWMRDQPPVTA